MQRARRALGRRGPRASSPGNARVATTEATDVEVQWFGPGVAGIGGASFLADAGHEIPTALLPSLLTFTLGASASALGVIEGVSDALAGVARLGGGALPDDPHRRRAVAVGGGYTTTAVLSAGIGAATAPWQVGMLRAGVWTARGLRVSARNALLADIVPGSMAGPRGLSGPWTTLAPSSALCSRSAW